MLGTFIAMKKIKLKGIMEKLIKLLFCCGISTVICGAAFGSWFGNFSFAVFGYTINPLLFDPMDDPMLFFILSFILGAIHLMTGMGISGYMMIKAGNWKGAIFDILTWYLVLIGAGMLFVGGMLFEIGKYMIIIGAVGLVVTQGRHEKNIIKKFGTGLLSLYNATGFLSDILSYSRLLALGLATSVISMVVNTMGVLGGTDNFAGILVLTVVFLIGHTFNLAINTLGTYVHTSRLQYVEFFSKFYTGGGQAFKPLEFKNKYIRLEK
jgi:V/A-type H+-transporting ATPase subunit I